MRKGGSRTVGPVDDGFYLLFAHGPTDAKSGGAIHKMKRNLHSIAAVVAVLHCGVSFAKDEKTETKQVDGASKREPSASPDPKTTAAEEARARRAAAQKALNDQVVAKEFKVEDPKKIDAYVEEQMKKKVKPVEQAPSHWRPGFTCNDLLAFQPVDWAAYRNCRYYYRYYGRYWR